MNAKITASVAVAVVALMVFAAAGATTFSWFSDSEDVDITVTAGKLDVSVGKVSIDGVEVEKPTVSENDGNEASSADIENIEAPNLVAPGYTTIIEYEVSFYSNIASKYNISFETDVDWMNVAGTVVVSECTVNKASAEKSLVYDKWDSLGEDSEEVEVKAIVTVTISYTDGIEMGEEAVITLTNEITQFARPIVDVDDDGKSVILINNADELRGFAYEINSGVYKNKELNVRITNDIDLGGNDWTPIGDSGAVNIGTFNGDGKTISNFIVTQSKCAGLFGNVIGDIENLKVSNVEVKGNDYAGAIVGAIYGNIQNCSAENVKVIVEPYHLDDGKTYDGGAKAGGIVGYFSEGSYTIDSCKVEGVSIKGYRDLGGIVGFMQYGTTEISCTAEDVTIEYISCDSYCDDTPNQNVGAIAGRIHEDAKVSFDDKTNGRFTLISPVKDADELIATLEGGNSVVLTGDVKINPAGMSNAYGTTGINIKNGQTIDGNGFVLDIKGAGGTWDSGINTTGGLIKNITVTGSFRGIFINHNSEHSERVVLENVIIDGTTYTISCDQGSNQGFTATDSTFKGWTSYAKTLGDAKFIDCYFGKGNGYSYCRPYAPTEFVGCDFEAGFTMDARATVTFENCTIGGVALTADNLSTLVKGNIANATVKG